MDSVNNRLHDRLQLGPRKQMIQSRNGLAVVTYNPYTHPATAQPRNPPQPPQSRSCAVACSLQSRSCVPPAESPPEESLPAVSLRQGACEDCGFRGRRSPAFKCMLSPEPERKQSESHRVQG